MTKSEPCAKYESVAKNLAKLNGSPTAIYLLGAVDRSQNKGLFAPGNASERSSQNQAKR